MACSRLLILNEYRGVGQILGENRGEARVAVMNHIFLLKTSASLGFISVTDSVGLALGILTC